MRSQAVLLGVPCAVAGCQSDSPALPPPVVIGYWTPIGAMQFTAPGGEGAEADNVALIRRVLGEHGIPVEMAYKGINVPYWQAREARDVLLTDPRLRDRDINVMIVVPAGTAERSGEGYMLPEVRR